VDSSAANTSISLQTNNVGLRRSTLNSTSPSPQDQILLATAPTTGEIDIPQSTNQTATNPTHATDKLADYTPCFGGSPPMPNTERIRNCYSKVNKTHFIWVFSIFLI
jgi:hypothetical protein